MLSKERLEWPTAIHEAAHAVTARVLGIEVEKVVIAIAPTDGGIMRLTEYGNLGDAPIRVRFKKYGYLQGWLATAKIMLAGRIAEERACPGKLDPEVNADGVLDADLAIFAEAIKRLILFRRYRVEFPPHQQVNRGGFMPEEEREVASLRKQLTRETKALVDKQWTAIERVAEALLSRRVLDGDEVDALIGRWRED
jgi:ATP-dependent Zn protease